MTLLPKSQENILDQVIGDILSQDNDNGKPRLIEISCPGTPERAEAIITTILYAMICSSKKKVPLSTVDAKKLFDYSYQEKEPKKAVYSYQKEEPKEAVFSIRVAAGDCLKDLIHPIKHLKTNLFNGASETKFFNSIVNEGGEGKIVVIPSCPESRLSANNQGVLIEALGRGHGISVNYELTRETLAENLDAYDLLKSKPKALQARRAEIMEAHRTQEKGKGGPPETPAIQDTKGREEAERLKKCKEMEEEAARQPKPADIGHLSGFTSYHPPQAHALAHALLKTAVEDLAAALDVRSEETLEIANASDDEKRTAALHRGLAEILLSKATVKRAANAVVLPKPLGGWSNVDRTQYKFQKNGPTISAAEEFLTEHAKNNPGVVLLLQAATLSEIGECKTAAEEYLDGKKEGETMGKKEDETMGLFFDEPPYKNVYDDVVAPALEAIFDRVKSRESKGR